MLHDSYFPNDHFSAKIESWNKKVAYSLPNNLFHESAFCQIQGQSMAVWILGTNWNCELYVWNVLK